MKTFLITTIAFLAFAITCKAQWTSTPPNIYYNTGNVGIGTTSPGTKLDVFDASGTSQINIARFNNSSNGYYSSLTAAGSSSVVPSWTNGSQILEFVTSTTGKGIISSYQAPLVFQTNYRTDRMIIDNNGNVGIGTSSPLGVLDVKLTTNQHIQFAPNVNGGYSGASGIVSINDGNTGYTPLGFYASNYYFGGGNVGIATTDTKGYTFAVNGTAIATSMTVKAYANWPDFVFKPTYQLPSLTEVKTYIDKNHHLPDVPSATEVEKNGLNLGEMNKVLVQKVEELTLYLIEKDKQIKVLEHQTALFQLQQKQIDDLKKSLNNLNHKRTK